MTIINKISFIARQGLLLKENIILYLELFVILGYRKVCFDLYKT